MSRESDNAFMAGLTIGLVIGLSVAGISTHIVGSRWTKDAHAHKVEAVRHGAAEWRTDENGQVSFHWKTNPVKP